MLALLFFLLDPCWAEKGSASPGRKSPGAVNGTFVSSTILSVEIDPPDASSQKILQEAGIAAERPYSPLVIKKGVEALYRTGAFR
ncbi:MAG TPA: hypothetical protein VFG95_02925, partial [Nitrospiria bacterium]|nr:hypothetical protein [Nitrospiria bacterium]